ncbi:MAG: Holliday junction branch migration protein RuvA [Alphaproteobacteria bacterium]
MIAKLTGLVDSLDGDGLILDVAGVGYALACSRRTLGRLPAPGGSATLFVETTIREDRIVLYGFGDSSERQWFRLLMTVQGVGARIALALLSTLAPDEIARAVAAQDKTLLTRADGVGPKLAARLVNELKDKVGEIAADAGLPRGTRPVAGGASTDAISALVNLGYGRTEAFGAVSHASERLGAEASVEALVRAGLKELAS